MKAIIIEDSRLARNELKNLLKAHPEIEIIAEAVNANEALVAITKHQPDLIFLDIQMPGKNGFELLEELDAIPLVIFTTAYDEYAVKSFEYNALDYLLKPIKAERLAIAIKKVIQTNKPTTKQETLTENKQVFVKDGEKCWMVKLADVRLFEIHGNYTRIFFEKNKPLILKSLNYMEARLDTSQFFRINRQQIINLKWVEKIEPWFNGKLKVNLRDGEEVEVSRRQAVKFREILSF